MEVEKLISALKAFEDCRNLVNNSLVEEIKRIRTLGDVVCPQASQFLEEIQEHAEDVLECMNGDIDIIRAKLHRLGVDGPI